MAMSLVDLAIKTCWFSIAKMVEHLQSPFITIQPPFITIKPPSKTIGIWASPSTHFSLAQRP
jgi:hypothetical protein